MERQYHATSANISPNDLDSEESWDAALFLLGGVGFMKTLKLGRPLSEIAEVFEGRRDVSGEDDLALLYRGSSILQFEITPTRDQWSRNRWVDEDAIRAGDVLLKRVAPVSVAIVAPGVPSFPVDGNIFVIRGLDQAKACWVAYCLSHPDVGNYLLSKSGRSILSRVSLSVLRSWKVPETPAPFFHFAVRFGSLLQKRVFLSGQITALEVEVEQAVAEQMASTGYEESDQLFAQSSWAFFFPAFSMDTSWLPIHVATDYRSKVLQGDRDWRPLRLCLLPEEPSRGRFSQFDEPLPVLRLSDVGEIPLVPERLEASVPSQVGRVYSEPIAAEDILLSTLGSSPRVAFAPIKTEPPVYAVDLWERLRFRSHAAAYALILQSSAIRRQLRSLASGSVLQFIRHEDVQRLVLPVHDDETLTHWDRSFRSLAKAWLQTDAEWKAMMREGWLVVSHAFNSTHQEVTEI